MHESFKKKNSFKNTVRYGAVIQIVNDTMCIRSCVAILQNAKDIFSKHIRTVPYVRASIVNKNPVVNIIISDFIPALKEHRMNAFRFGRRIFLS